MKARFCGFGLALVVVLSGSWSESSKSFAAPLGQSNPPPRIQPPPGGGWPAASASGSGVAPWSAYTDISLDADMGLKVNDTNGNLMLTLNGLHLRGVNGLDESINATYNSLSATSLESDMGNGWLLGTGSDVGLYLGDGPTPTPSAFYDETGQSYPFSGTCPFTTWPAGLDAQLTCNGSSSYALTFNESKLQYQFNSGGYLSAEQNREGNRIIFAYDPSTSLLTSITNTEGQATNVYYDASGIHIHTITDPSGRTWTYNVDSNHNLASVTDPLGHVTQFTYDGSSNLTRIVDPKGNITLLTYANGSDTVAQIVRVTNTGNNTGPTWTFSYGSGSTQVSDPNSHTTTYAFDASGRVTQVTDPEGHATQASWNGDNKPAATTDARGNTTSYGYTNTNSDLNSVAMPSSANASATYPLQGQACQYNPSTTTDTQNRTTNYLYDQYNNCRTTQTTDAAGHAASVSYNSDGTVASSVDERGNKTSYGYSSSGNSSGLRSQVSYQAAGDQYYALSGSTGQTFVDMDPVSLSLSITPSSTCSAVLGGNADLFTSVSGGGNNQDMGIFIAGGSYGSGQLLAWEESAAAAPYSPNASFVQAVATLQAGVTYTVKLQWKSNGTQTGIIYAGAGPWNESHSPTRLTALCAPSSGVSSVANTTGYYQLTANGSGATWFDMDPTNLKLQVTPASSCSAVLSGNASLFTSAASGYNQDIAIFISGGSYGSGTVLAWKESGDAAAYSPNAAFVQTVASLSAGTTYTIKLQWRVNTAQTGGSIYAGAGPWNNTRSATSLTSICDASNTIYSAVSPPTTYYALTGSTGQTFVDMDTTNLQLTITPSANCTGIVSANADLFSSVPSGSYGNNQDIAIFISGGSFGNGSVVAWKESGAAAQYSPNAAFAQTVQPLAANTAYTIKLQWKTNGTQTPGGYIYAGAGPIGGVYSPTRLTVQCSPTSTVSVAPQLVGPTMWAYNSFNLESNETDGKDQKSSFQYDNLGQLTSVTYGDGSAISYTYDADGNVASMVDSTGTTSYSYNALNQETQETLPNTQVISYTWDGVDNMLSKGDSGGTVSYSYTAADHLASVTDPQGARTTFAYDNDGRRTNTFYPNGVTESMTYNADGQLTRIAATAGGTTLKSYTYSYTNPSTNSPQELRYSMTDASGTVTSYTYDPLNRLTQASGGSGTYSYSYDAVGNMLSQTINGTTTSMSYSVDDQLTAAGSRSYTYDANGNQTSVTGGNSFSYNAQYQTKSITPYGGSAISMTYTGDGQTKRTARGSDSFQNDETGISQFTSSATNYFTRTPDGDLISERVGGATYYYLFDGLDSVVGMTNSSGSLVNQYAYDPYGNATTASEQVSNPFRFTGSVWDSSAGLYKMGARYYDPGVGRFTQLDPRGGRYAYVRDNPVNWTDPNGLDDPIDWKLEGSGDEGARGGGEGRYAPDESVDEILKGKKGSIKNVRLPKGSPSWEQARRLKWRDIVRGAKAHERAYMAFYKLLVSRRYDKPR